MSGPVAHIGLRRGMLRLMRLAILEPSYSEYTFSYNEYTGGAGRGSRVRAMRKSGPEPRNRPAQAIALAQISWAVPTYSRSVHPNSSVSQPGRTALALALA